MKINQTRIAKRLEALSKIGMNENGGVTRLAFGDEDLKARAYILQIMETAGLSVKIDASGNIIGRKHGRYDDWPAIAIGSHIDTVNNGGKYDGALGVISAIDVIQTLDENDHLLDHPLEVIVFCDEEGSMIGSSIMADTFSKNMLKEKSPSGWTIADGVQRIGGDLDNLQTAIRDPKDLLCFMELHNEQGGVLEDQNIDIGVVTGIVGIRRWDITIEGVANHAGTTPMDQRKDALLAASYFIIEVNNIAKIMKGSQVATIGKLDIESPSVNVIPGKVKLSLEIRDVSEKKIIKVYNRIKKEPSVIAEKTKTRLTIRANPATAKPAMMHQKLKMIIAQSAEKQGCSSLLIPSGAGHDSQNMATRVPTGMIFVPSAGGISHSSKEFTHPEFCEKGANVLLNAVIIADGHFNI